MKNLGIVLAVALLVLPAAASAQDRTVEGELVDSMCALAMGATGEGHKECAERCAAAGFPVGVLTADGQHYSILSPAGAFKGHMASQIRVTGLVDEATKTIMAHKVEAQQGNGWVEISLPAMPEG